MRWLRSPLFLLGLALLGGVVVSTIEHWTVLRPIALTIYSLIHTAVFVTVVLGIVLGSLVLGLRFLFRVLVGLICSECQGRRLQRLRSSPFGRRRYLCRNCGAILWHHPFGLELHVAPPDPSVPRPTEALRYPPAHPTVVAPPIALSSDPELVDGPAGSLARLVAARRTSRHRPTNGPEPQVPR
jgi:hypothetical protein